MTLYAITDRLVCSLQQMHFSAPVAWVYNPLDYAAKPYATYLEKYGRASKEIVLVGMNPGPWGMVQTGVPFGTISMVRDWLQITGPVGQPERLHPKRPVKGFACSREEVSGKRVWNWAKSRFTTPRVFFERFFIANYCPLAFFDEQGRNLTPDKIARSDRSDLFSLCDQALKETIDLLDPRFVLGFGQFAYARIQACLTDTTHDRILDCLLHPSPANPKANQNWEQQLDHKLTSLGIKY
ncbi:single-stranded DNA-binding protein [bacterium]|nr:single-stranded DNA-binding protein [bacterium]